MSSGKAVMSLIFNMVTAPADNLILRFCRIRSQSSRMSNLGSFIILVTKSKVLSGKESDGSGATIVNELSSPAAGGSSQLHDIFVVSVHLFAHVHSSLV